MGDLPSCPLYANGTPHESHGYPYERYCVGIPRRIRIGDCVTLNADSGRNPVEFTVTANPSTFDPDTLDIVDRFGHLYHPFPHEVTLCYRREAVR